MTATNIVCQPRHDCLHVVADAAMYSPDGVVQGLGSKIFTVSHWPGVICIRGAARAVLVSQWLSGEFADFDAMVAGIEDMLPTFVAAADLHMGSELILAGWSASRAAPEAYIINTSDELPVGCSDEMAATAEHLPPAFKLQRLPDTISGPAVQDFDIINAANFEGVDVDGPPELAIWNLKKLVEMQRQAGHSDGVYWVGGFAQLATVTPSGITQRILQRWPEDRIGERMMPAPVDWAAWHRENPRPVAQAGVSAAALQVCELSVDAFVKGAAEAGQAGPVLGVEMMAAGLSLLTPLSVPEARLTATRFLSTLADNSEPPPAGPSSAAGVVPFRNRAERRRAEREAKKRAC
jgi:hypothetical protein